MSTYSYAALNRREVVQATGLWPEESCLERVRSTARETSTCQPQEGMTRKQRTDALAQHGTWLFTNEKAKRACWATELAVAVVEDGLFSSSTARGRPCSQLREIDNIFQLAASATCRPSRRLVWYTVLMCDAIHVASASRLRERRPLDGLSVQHRLGGPRPPASLEERRICAKTHINCLRTHCDDEFAYSSCLLRGNE